MTRKKRGRIFKIRRRLVIVIIQLNEQTIGLLRSGTGKIGQEVLRIINDIRAIEVFYHERGISLVSVKMSLTP